MRIKNSRKFNFMYLSLCHSRAPHRSSARASILSPSLAVACACLLGLSRPTLLRFPTGSGDEKSSSLPPPPAFIRASAIQNAFFLAILFGTAYTTPRRGGKSRLPRAAPRRVSAPPSVFRLVPVPGPCIDCLLLSHKRYSSSLRLETFCGKPRSSRTRYSTNSRSTSSCAGRICSSNDSIWCGSIRTPASF